VNTPIRRDLIWEAVGGDLQLRVPRFVQEHQKLVEVASCEQIVSEKHHESLVRSDLLAVGLHQL